LGKNSVFRWIAKAEETIVMKHALKNTTAVLRGLAAGNLTDIASLLSGAYAEVSSISSLLLGVPPPKKWVTIYRLVSFSIFLPKFWGIKSQSERIAIGFGF